MTLELINALTQLKNLASAILVELLPVVAITRAPARSAGVGSS